MLLVLLACTGATPVDPTPDETLFIGDVKVDQASINFGDVALGEDAEVLLRLDNTNVDFLTMTAAIEGDSAFQVPVSTLGLPEGEALVTLRFVPDIERSYAGALLLTASTGETGRVALLGAGVGEGTSADAPDIAITPQMTFDYQDVNVGASAVKAFTVANNGNVPLTITSIASSDSVFALSGDFALPMTLPAAATRRMDVTFTPTAARVYSGQLVIASNDPDGDLTLSLRGAGVVNCTSCAPDVAVYDGTEAATSLVFSGDADTVITRRIRIVNEGDETLLVSRVEVRNDRPASGAGNVFAVPGWNQADSLAPGDERTVEVTYTWTGDSSTEVADEAADENVLHVRSNDPDEPDLRIPLSFVAPTP